MTTAKQSTLLKLSGKIRQFGLRVVQRMPFGENIENFYVSRLNTGSRRRKTFAKSVDNVDRFVSDFRKLKTEQLLDESFLESYVIEKIGLNNEALHEQPPELAPYYGKGLFLWQYPKQFAKYLVWLMNNAGNCSSYLEIGCRWGGTFIVVCEVLRRASPTFNLAIAADLIEKTPFIDRYMQIAKQSGLRVEYFKGSSTSKEFEALVAGQKPDISFIDGDHRFMGAFKDHMLVREFSKIIVHHDIASQSCPDTKYLWQVLIKLEENKEKIEFAGQYPSVDGDFLGIGVLNSK